MSGVCTSNSYCKHKMTICCYHQQCFGLEFIFKQWPHSLLYFSCAPWMKIIIFFCSDHMHMCFGQNAFIFGRKYPFNGVLYAWLCEKLKIDYNLGNFLMKCKTLFFFSFYELIIWSAFGSFCFLCLSIPLTKIGF